MIAASSSWCILVVGRVLKNPVVASPIVGISNARSLHDACSAQHLVLSEGDCKIIEDAYKVRDIEWFSLKPNYGV
jgi:aryl-alcohol dehydrogenase-like predicted oxidoreductase